MSDLSHKSLPTGRNINLISLLWVIYQPANIYPTILLNNNEVWRSHHNNHWQSDTQEYTTWRIFEKVHWPRIIVQILLKLQLTWIFFTECCQWLVNNEFSVGALHERLPIRQPNIKLVVFNNISNLRFVFIFAKQWDILYVSPWVHQILTLFSLPCTGHYHYISLLCHNLKIIRID